MIPSLAGLKRGIAAFVKHGDPQPVLAPEAVIDADVVAPAPALDWAVKVVEITTRVP